MVPKAHGTACRAAYTHGIATSQSTADFLVDQLKDAGHIRSRKMFGEYALYCDDRVVALICDDRLYVKPTAAGKEFLGNVAESPPYPGAKPHFVVEEDRWEDSAWLCELIMKTAAQLPVPKKKR